MNTKFTYGFLIMLVFTGCTFSYNRTFKNDIEDRFDAEEITKAFYIYQSTDNKEILELFSNGYLNKIGNDSLQAFLKHRKVVLGNLRKDSLEKWETKSETGQNSGISYFLEYNNLYNNSLVKESFIMAKGFFGKIKITDYRYEIIK